LTESQYALIRIPYQIINVNLIIEVEHPLKIPCEFIQGELCLNDLYSVNGDDSIESSLIRLVSLANRLSRNPDRLVQQIPVSTIVVRDLLKGTFWPLRELRINLDDSNNYSNVKSEPRILSKTLDSEKLSEIIEPMKGFLAKLSDLDRNEVTKHTRIESYDIHETEYAATKVRLISSTGGRKQWVYDSGPFGHLISEYIETIPGFEPILPQIKEVETEYPYSPEVQAIINLRKDQHNKDKIEYGKSICRNLPKQIKKEDCSRLESIHTLVGSSRDIWDAAIQVLKTSKNSALVLSSFTNSYTLDHVSQQLLEASTDSNLEHLFISIGEPDRISGMEYVDKSNSYLTKLK